MKVNWGEKKLGEVCDIVNGSTPLRNNKSYWEGGDVPWFTIDDIRLQGRIIKETKQKVTRTALKNTSLRLLPPKSVLLCCTASIGEFAYTVIPLTTNQQFNGLIVKNEKTLNPQYLFHYCSTLKEILSNLSGKTTIDFIPISRLRDIEIPLPPLPEQQRIVTILDQSLAAIATAKANTEKNLKNARELFDTYLQYVGGDCVPLGKLVEIKTGKLDANAAEDNGKYPFFTCSRETYSIDNYAFDCEAILLAGNNAVGDFNVKHYKGKFNAYQRTYVITVNKDNLVLYRYLYYQLLGSLKEFKEKSVGAGTKFLKMGMIQEMQIPLPTIKEQIDIVERLDLLSSETKKLEVIYKKKLADLEELKRSILQKAFKGELTEG